MVDPDPAISQALAQRHHGARRERVQAEARIDVAYKVVPAGADIRQGKIAGKLGRLYRLQLATRAKLIKGRISGP